MRYGGTGLAMRDKTRAEAGLEPVVPDGSAAPVSGGMIEAGRTAAVVLAAGASSRFGSAKALAPLRGRPLAPARARRGGRRSASRRSSSSSATTPARSNGSLRWRDRAAGPQPGSGRRPVQLSPHRAREPGPGQRGRAHPARRPAARASGRDRAPAGRVRVRRPADSRASIPGRRRPKSAAHPSRGVAARAGGPGGSGPRARSASTIRNSSSKSMSRDRIPTSTRRRILLRWRPCRTGPAVSLGSSDARWRHIR